MTDEKVNISAFARVIGVSHVAVHHAINRGRLRNSISVDAKGRKWIAVELGKKEWGYNTDHDKNRNDGAGGRPAAAPVGQSDLFGDATKDKQAAPKIAMFGNKSLSEWRVADVALGVRNAQLDLDERSGKLIDVEVEKAEWFLRARRCRDRLLVIPDRIAGSLAAESKPDLCFSMLKREIEDALKELVRDR